MCMDEVRREARRRTGAMARSPDLLESAYSGCGESHTFDSSLNSKCFAAGQTKRTGTDDELALSKTWMTGLFHTHTEMHSYLRASAALGPASAATIALRRDHRRVSGRRAGSFARAGAHTRARKHGEMIWGG